MAVIGIMALLAVVAVPSLKGLMGSSGKKQAIAQILGALEIARNTAIASGTNAAVVFPGRNFTNNPSYGYRSMAVVAWNPTNTNASPTMVGSWIVMPQGVVLHANAIDLLPTLGTNVVETPSLIIPPDVTAKSISRLPAVVFGYDGSLEEGSHYTNSISTGGISLYEGNVLLSNLGFPTATTNTSRQQTNVETIRITRFTGRPVTTLAKPQ